MADYSRQRAERDFDRNPPANAPGQGASGWDDMEMDSGVGNLGMGNPGMGTGLGDFSGGAGDINSALGQGFGNPNMNNGMGGYNPNGVSGLGQGQGQMQNGNGYSFGQKVGDAAESAAISFGKGLWNFTKLFFAALKNNTKDDWNALGTRVTILSLVVGAVGLLLMVLSLFLNITGYMNLLSMSALGIATGAVVVFFNPKSAGGNAVQEPIEEPAMTFDDPFSGSNDSFGDDGEESFDPNPFDSSEDGGGWGWDDDDSSDWDPDAEAAEAAGVAGSPDFDAGKLAEAVTVPAGQYTRSYLVETFMKVLPLINPSFHSMENIYEESDEFMMFDGYVKDAARQTGLNEDKLCELYLIAAERNLFVVRLTCSRPSGIKEQEIADGVADCYKRDEYGVVIDSREGVYASVDTSVGKFSIILFLCNSVMVSLGDVFAYKKDFISDPKNIMPLFWGVNEMGKTYCYDGAKAGNGSLLISGEGRSGKSWKGQSLVAQMSMFMSPKELEFYFFDIKNKLSDYYYLSTKLPHVRGFCGDPLKFVVVLEGIIEREKKIRSTKIFGAGVNNINDYNKANPMDKLSYIYIVVDEMAAAMKAMDSADKELHSRFDSLMTSVVTQLPYFGIRLMLFPHRIVNDIINKTVATQISCRSVVGVLDFETLKAAVDVRNKKDFPYNLVKPGDMAIRTKDIRNGNATYTHSEVLADSEQANRNIFDYIGAVWGRLEPDCKVTVGVGAVADTGNYSMERGNRKASTGTTQPRDTAYDMGEYSARNVHGSGVVGTVGGTPFTDDDDDSVTVDDLFGSGNADDDFWSSFKGGQ